MHKSAADTQTNVDYDSEYVRSHDVSIVGENADLPLFFTVETHHKIATSAALLERCAAYLPDSEIKKVQDAFRYADAAHLGQFRKSGEPYITHPLAVASTLARWHMDAATICAGLMHDVLEDTGINKDEMAQRFGVAVADLVDGVSKLDRINFASTEIAQAESIRKMFLAMARDIRVILIKLADRLHNMRTLGVMRPEKRRRIATETLEIYVPIAHHLGLNMLYRELKELAFIHQHPKRYRVLKERVFATRDKRREVLERIYQETKTALPKSNIKARIQGRDRTIYGIYNRMKETHASFSEALDIYGFRIIVKTEEDCYLTLCALHKLYKPVHQRFKDFIAVPKTNGYQSLHTTVIGPNSTPIEFQIRTEKMHRIDENGLLSHWIYNDGIDTSEIQSMVTKWIQNLIDIQESSANSSEFVENIKADLFPNRIYVFTPRSKIITLPQGSTPIDFAYQVHTAIGNKTVACKVNGEDALLSTVLENGDMVEVQTDDMAHPDPEWLHFVRSGRARAEIRQYLREKNANDSVKIGNEAFEKAAKEARLDPSAITKDVWDEILKEMAQPTIWALYADIGLGKVFAAALVARILKLLTKEKETDVVEISGTDNAAVQFAHCCHPLPGDTIAGFMRLGHGLEVHRTDCDKIERVSQLEKHNRIPLAWKDENEPTLFAVPIELTLTDSRETLAQVATQIARAHSSITGITMSSSEKATFETTRLMIQVKNQGHLEHIVQALKTIENVKGIDRCLDGIKRLKLI